MQTQNLPRTPTLLATPHRFLLHTPTNTAILSDLHLGIEHAMRQQGLAFPNINEQKIRESWRHLLTTLESRAHQNKSHSETNSGEAHSPNEAHPGGGGGGVIIAGDLFDSPTPDPAALALAHELFAALPKNFSLTLLPGNHDPDPTTLRTLFPDPRITITDSTTLAENLLLHGHRWPTKTLPNPSAIPPNDAQNTPKTIQKPPENLPKPLENVPICTAIVGHQHPAIILHSRLQSAKMICYATCQLSTKDPGRGALSTLIILPTFSRAPLGTNLISRRWIIDCPQPAPENIRIAGIVEARSDSRVLDFGPLANL